MNIKSVNYNEKRYSEDSEPIFRWCGCDSSEIQSDKTDNELKVENDLLKLLIMKLNEEITSLRANNNRIEAKSSDEYDDEKDYIPLEPHARRQVKIKVKHRGRGAFPLIIDEDD